MATSVLLVANPLTSLKQTSQIPFSRLRSLPTRPFQFTKATLSTQHLSSSASSGRYDLILKCSSEKNHFTSEHASQSEVNQPQDPLKTMASEILSNVLKGLKTPAVENPPFDAIFNETLSSVLKGLQTTAIGIPNLLEAIFNGTLASALKVLKTPVMAAVLLTLLLSFHPNSAWAASGGRIGGSSFSSRSSSSSSPESSSNSSSSSRRSSSPSYSSSSSNSRRSSSPSYSHSSSNNSSSPSYSYSSSNSSSPSYSSSPSNSYTSYSSCSKPSSSSPTSSSSSNDMSEAEALLWLLLKLLMFLLKKLSREGSST